MLPRAQEEVKEDSAPAAAPVAAGPKQRFVEVDAVRLLHHTHTPPLQLTLRVRTVPCTVGRVQLADQEGPYGAG